MSGETAAERWSPAQRAETVLLSILSLLDDPEPSSPANVDAGVMFRNDLKGFKARVKQDVEISTRDIPKDFIMPTAHEAKAPEKVEDDHDFWVDSDAEDEDLDFDDGSESGMDMEFDDDEDDEDADSGEDICQ